MARQKAAPDRIYFKQQVIPGPLATIQAGTLMDLNDGLIHDPVIQSWLASGVIETVLPGTPIAPGVVVPLVTRADYAAWTRTAPAPSAHVMIEQAAILRRYHWDQQQFEIARGRFGFPAASTRRVGRRGITPLWKTEVVEQWERDLTAIAANVIA